MSFTVFCNVSRYLVRNLNLLKLQQSATTNRINRIKLPKTQHLSESKPWTSAKACTCKAVIQKYNRSADDNGNEYYWSYNERLAAVFGSALSFSLFSFGKSKEEEEETPEEKLITTIKRSILCIQREQYEKAEQMLHLALRMAQDIRSSEGITYVYDIMANLALQREQFKKAEKLFTEVMQRLIRAGHTEDSPQMLHISAKMAHMAQLQGDLEKSALGFEWTLQKVEQRLKEMPEDRDLLELFGLTKNWYGQLLMIIGKYSIAKKMFKEAYDCLIEIYGQVNEEAITILNNLSVACVNLDEFAEAKQQLMLALELVKELQDSTQASIIEANLGLVFLREGLLKEAKEHCTLAYRMAKKQKNAEATEQAEYCLDEIKTSTN